MKLISPIHQTKGYYLSRSNFSFPSHFWSEQWQGERERENHLKLFALYLLNIWRWHFCLSIFSLLLQSACKCLSTAYLPSCQSVVLHRCVFIFNCPVFGVCLAILEPNDTSAKRCWGYVVVHLPLKVDDDLCYKGRLAFLVHIYLVRIIAVRVM